MTFAQPIFCVRQKIPEQSKVERDIQRILYDFGITSQVFRRTEQVYRAENTGRPAVQHVCVNHLVISTSVPPQRPANASLDLEHYGPEAANQS